MAAAESKPSAELSAAPENDSPMARPPEGGDGKALAQLGSAQNQKDAYGDSTSSGSSLLRRIIDTIPALAWCARPDGSIEFLNKQWLDYTGLSPAEASDFGYQATFHPDDLKRKREECRELFSGNGPAESEVRLRRYDGLYRWFLVRVEPFRDETGKIIRWYGTSTDIEALKQTEAKLREEERDLRRIIDSIPQAIVVQDPAGAPLYANRGTLDYTGLVLEDVVKPNFRERIFHPDDIQRLSEYRKSALARARFGQRRPVSMVPYSVQSLSRRARTHCALVRDRN
jgi:PAS domain S-box-containing protein